MNNASRKPRTSGAWRIIAAALIPIASFCSAAEAAPPVGTFHWDPHALAASMHLEESAVHEYFTDGRRISFIMERRIAREVLHGKLAENEGTPYDVIDAQGGRWEVRSLSDHGMYFCPSSEVGSGRHFDLAGFLGKLGGIRGYIVTDIEGFPDVPYWKIDSATVMKWWRAGELGTETRISRKKALALFASAPPARE